MPSFSFGRPILRGAARLRVRVAREGPARELSHLAQIESLRRAVERSGLPVLRDGKRRRPRPRLSFGPAISVGYESLAEYFDMELSSMVDPSEAAKALAGSLEAGFSVSGVRRIPAFFPSLEATINVVRYEVSGPFPEGAGQALARLLERPEIVIEKVKDEGARVVRVDAKPLIRSMSLPGPDRLELTLRFGPGRTIKPEALLREWLGPAARVEDFRVLRKELLSETSGGELMSP